MGMIDTPLLSVLQSAMDYASTRQEALADNIANIDTPGYQRKDASFASVLASAADSSSQSGAATLTLQAKEDNPSDIEFPGASSAGNVQVETDATGAMRADGNNVDMDVEMGRLAKNQIYYEGLSQLVSGQFAGLKFVIEEAK